MAGSIEIIGNEGSVIYYNLNKQFSNLRKIIITKEILINSFEGEGVRTLFNDLSSSTRDSYMDILIREKSEGAFDGPVNTDLYKQIQEYLPKISQNMMDIQLKDYNFMSSISNARFNVVLRCDNFSITKYYEEKGQIMSSIKSLIKQYLEFEGNIFRISRLENFQIEIYESEEIYKHITLKKEGNSITLASSYSFPRNKPFDFALGQEFYFSVGEDFHFYKNTQDTAIIREQNKLVEREINKQDKILSNNELMLINDNTKNINDALIEMYLNPKGALRIVNVSIVENNIFPNASDDGFVINKSSRNYDRISLLTLRDSLDEDFPNPKYLLLRNEGEIKEFLLDLGKLRYIDGLIFTSSFYVPLLDKIGKNMDLDIIYYNKILKKSLDLRIDFDNLEIDGAMGSSSSSSNPFSSIIGRENRERDAYLERLKNVDLSTPVDRNSSASSSSAYGGIEGINNLTQSIISSPESSMKRNSSYNSGASGSSGSSGGGGGIYGSVPSSGSGGKISAISMLAASALNKPEKKPEPILEPQVEKKTQFQNTSQFHDNSQFHNNLESIAPSNMRNTHSSTNSRVSNGKSVFEDLARDEISSVSSSGNMMRNNSFSNSNLKNSSASFSDNYREELENQEQEYDEDIFSSKSNRNHNRNDFSSNSSSFSNSSDDFEDDYGSSPKSFDDMFEDERSQDNFSHKNQSYSSSRPDFDMDDEMNDEDDSSQRSYSQNNPSNYFDDDYQNSLNSSKNMNNGGNRSNDFSFNQTNRNVNYNLKSSSIKLLTNPNIVNSGHYFVDHSSLSKVRNGNVFLMTTNLEDLENPNKNYVVPISIMERSQIDDNVYLLVNSTNEYFLIDEEMGAKYFLNLTFIDSSVKRNFLLETINRLGKLSLMISKEDINLLDGCMDAIENIFIRDLNSNEEYERIKNKINSLSR